MEILVEEDAVDAGLAAAGSDHGLSPPLVREGSGSATSTNSLSLPTKMVTGLPPTPAAHPTAEAVPAAEQHPLTHFNSYREKRDTSRDRQSSPIAASEDLEDAITVSSGSAPTVVDHSSQNSNESAPNTDGTSNYTDSANVSPGPGGTSTPPRPVNRKRQHTSSTLGGSMLISNKRSNRTIPPTKPTAEVHVDAAPTTTTPGHILSPRPARTVHSVIRGKEKREARKARASLTRRQKIESEAWGSNVVDGAPDDGRRLTRGRAKDATGASGEVDGPAKAIKELYI